jgi:hypothetical protein
MIEPILEPLPAGEGDATNCMGDAVVRLSNKGLAGDVEEVFIVHLV